jgi:hypothetical protein
VKSTVADDDSDIDLDELPEMKPALKCKSDEDCP